MKDRFEFGKNWANFLQNLTEQRILEAQKSLQDKLGVENLANKTFLDIGSGSGIFSLAAFRLGATVYSFDYDDNSVKCTNHLREKYADNDANWSVVQGSVLDEAFIEKIPAMDIVYSWGVLHHTGDMYRALNNVVSLVKEDGTLFISIYNDQGFSSKCWKWVKKKYNATGCIGKKVLLSLSFIRLWSFRFFKDLLKHGNPLKTWRSYADNRGMSAWYDVVDWVGGYPFEVAKPEEIFDFFRDKSFVLKRLITCAGGIGCNEFVFSK